MAQWRGRQPWILSSLMIDRETVGTVLPIHKVGGTSDLLLTPKILALPQRSDSIVSQFSINAVSASKFNDFQVPTQNFNCPILRGKGRGQQKSKTLKRHNNLKIWLRFDVGDRFFEVQALIDTGAEVNVIKRGIVPQNFIIAIDEPITISAANSSKLDGGSLCINCTAVINGFKVDTKKQADIHCPIF